MTSHSPTKTSRCAGTIKTAHTTIWLVSLVLLTGTSSAGAFELITAAEYEAQQSASADTFGSAPSTESEPVVRDNSGAPLVEVVAPDPKLPVAAPINIEIRFRVENGSEVDLSTFKVLYGLFKVDVTNKLLSAPGVRVSTKGIHVNDAQLPKGKHKFVIEISDKLGRVGRRLLEVLIV